MSAADLEARGIHTLEDIAVAAPQVSYTPALNSLTTLSLYMRGAGPTAPGQITLDGAVGMYEDGFYVSRLQANTFDLIDLRRVEILSGPQGALYGRDTTGGVIAVTSEAPSGSLRFNQDVDFGNRNSYRIMSSLDSPQWHNLSAKVTLLASGIDGYVNNLQANQQDFGAQKQRAARLQLRWDALSNLRLDYFVERASDDSTPQYDSDAPLNGELLYPGYLYYADPRGPMGKAYRPVFLPLSTSNHTAQGLTVAWRSWPALSIESRTGYRTMNAEEINDNAEFDGYPLETDDLYNVRQLTEDLRFSGELFGQQLRYLAGGSYLEEKGTHDSEFIEYVAEEASSSNIASKSRSRAVFAQLTGQPAFFGRRLEVSIAGRYTRDSKDAGRSLSGLENEAGDANHLSYNRATPQAELTYRWMDGLSTYAKVATAYQAGGALETAAAGDFTTAIFKPETSKTYELGLQSACLDHRVAADGAVFYTQRKDVQYALPVALLVDDVFDFQRATVKGADLHLTANALRDLTVTAQATYLRSAVNRADVTANTLFDPAGGDGSPYVRGQNINSLFVLPYTPKYSGSIAGDYTALHLDRSDVRIHLDYVYRAEMFATAAAGPGVPGSGLATQAAYGLLNGRVTYTTETDWAHHVKFGFWGRNLLKREYVQPAAGFGGGVQEFNSTNTAPYGYTSRVGAWAEPRTYGLSIRYEY